jgi:farnesyl diphosphate synthase
MTPKAAILELSPMSASAPAKRSTKRAFESRLASIATETESVLQNLLGRTPEDGETARPARLLEAMRYASLAGGKRIRPLFVVEAARLFGVKPEQAMMTAAAVECIHAYSLVHDDLPAMDNDALRRGRPTAHKAFDEATAILAGDALLTFAFDLLARPQTHADPAVRITLVGELARAAGLGGMAGGQLLDLAAEGRFGKVPRGVITEDAVIMLEGMKTGALIRAACTMGATLGKASRDARRAMDFYGYALGQAFQIADDLLDLEGDPKTVGKKTKKDAAAGKATFISVLGVEGARARLATLVATAEAAVKEFGENAAMLRAAAHFVANRKS